MSCEETSASCASRLCFLVDQETGGSARRRNLLEAKVEALRETNHDGRISWQSSYIIYINIMYYVFCILSIFIFIFLFIFIFSES